MKTIKYLSALTIALLLASITFNAYSQDDDEDGQEISTKVKIPVNTAQIKKIVFKDLLGGIVVVGVTGNEINAEVDGFHKPPKKAQGLKPVYGSGCADNTGIGVAANESEGVLTICGASRGSSDANFTFSIPKGIAISISYESPFANDDIVVKDMDAEVEIATLTSDIKCLNVTGPLVLNSTSGDAEITISKLNQNSPTSISLVSGDLDITLPAVSPAQLNLSSITGEIYTDFDLKLKSDKGGLNHVGGGEIEANINNGGVSVKLNCVSGNIYLRKK